MSAELTRDEKHEISHRGKAMRVLLQRLSAE
jgi:inosine/xanthosine triphosphate pyrophosphatase family protein